MAKSKEPTTVTDVVRTVNGKVVNPRDIEFPYDQYGFTTLLRKEGVRAVGRIKGDEDKLDVFLHTLRVLGEHAKMKIADQVKQTEMAVAARENREKAQYVRNEQDKAREVSRLEAMLAAAKAAVVAKVDVPEDKTDADE